MRRFGDTDRFLDLLVTIRERCPHAGVRSNFIVGFPGETEEDLAELECFLTQARLDAIGIFGYSDEDGTEAADMDGKLPGDEISERAARLSALAEQLVTERALDRVGETVEVLVESLIDGESASEAGSGIRPAAEGRAAHQAPEVDGSTSLTELADSAVGALITARVIEAVGADLVAAPIGLPR
jgi:tRNA A37 methylthiotransferase MiaB